MGGAFVDSGFGSIRPRINQNSCPKIPTRCRFCQKELEALEEWPSHVMLDCDRVPCAFSKECVHEGMLDFSDRIFLDSSSKFINVSYIINEQSSDNFCTWGTCNTTKQTWKQMLQHLQRHINDTHHSQVKHIFASLRDELSSHGQENAKRKAFDPSTSRKSPRYSPSTPRLITCCKKVPNDANA